MISDELKDRIEDGRKGLNRGFSTGSIKLDSVIQGVQGSTYTLIGGNTGTGKTAFADHSFVLMPYHEMLNHPELNLILRVFYKSFEIERVRKVAKWACHLLLRKYGIIVDINLILSINKNRISDDIYTKVMSMMEYLDKMSDFVHIQDLSTNPTGIFMDTKKYMDSNGKIVEHKKLVRDQEITFHKYVPNNPNEIVIVITDHIGLLRHEKELHSIKERIDKYSEQCITLRNFYGVSSVAISQFNRELADIDRRRFTELTPQLEDFKNTGNCSEDANNVMTLFNPIRYALTEYGGLNVNRFGGRYRSISVLKTRDGSDMIKVNQNFLGECGYFRDFPDPFMEHHYRESKDYTKFT